MRKVISFVLLVGLLATGCEVCDNCISDCDYCNCIDDQPPAIPTGVYSITGDGFVIVRWNPVYEADLAGYGVYRSHCDEGRYTRIGEVRRGEETEFIDYDVVNGVTYFYAVDAFDYSGNESELSYETVDDTPRPEGWDVEWYTYEYKPEDCAIVFLPDNETIAFTERTDPSAQYYLTRDGEGCMRIVPLHDIYGFPNLIQDYGYTYSIDDVDEAPIEGWSSSSLGVEVIVGHTYVMKTSNGYYAKVRVASMGNYWIVIDWALQIQQGSTELSPPAWGGRGLRR